VTRAESQSRPRRLVAGLILGLVGLAMFVLAIALLLIVLAGIILLIAGLHSWLRPVVDVASAWARTLGGIGLIAGGAGLAALGWLAVERLAGPLAHFAHLAQLRNRASGAAAEGETTLRRIRKFVAVLGILLALICLPFAAAIHVTAHAPWFGWGG
jgi:hypothetical protein